MRSFLHFFLLLCFVAQICSLFKQFFSIEKICSQLQMVGYRWIKSWNCSHADTIGWIDQSSLNLFQDTIGKFSRNQKFKLFPDTISWIDEPKVKNCSKIQLVSYRWSKNINVLINQKFKLFQDTIGKLSSSLRGYMEKKVFSTEKYAAVSSWFRTNHICFEWKRIQSQRNVFGIFLNQTKFGF